MAYELKNKLRGFVEVVKGGGYQRRSELWLKAFDQMPLRRLD